MAELLRDDRDRNTSRSEDAGARMPQVVQPQSGWQPGVFHVIGKLLPHRRVRRRRAEGNREHQLVAVQPDIPGIRLLSICALSCSFSAVMTTCGIGVEWA